MALDAGIGANSASDSYDIDNSCKFESDNVEYLTQTPSSDGNRQKFTISLWVKRCELSSYQTLYGAQPSGGYSNANTFQFCFTPDDKLGLGLQTYWVFQTNRVFRDTSAWYHIVVRADTTQPFSHNRIRVYINGVQDTSFSISATVTQDQLLGVNHTTRQQIGSLIANSWHSNNYIAEINLIDGQSHYPGYFGQTNADGEWVAKKYTGTYGTNGFYLDFENSSNLGEDQSGNNNDWALNNLSAIDQSTDTPTNNFCTLNNNSSTNGNIHTEHGGTYVSTDGGSGWCSMNATMGVSNGKWYWEGQRENNSDGTYVMVGIAGWNDPWIPHRSGGYYLGNVSTGGSAGWYYLNGTVYNSSGTWGGAAQGDITMFALDMDNGKIYFGKNGTWQNSSNPATNTNGSTFDFSGVAHADDIVLPSVSVYQGGRTRMNFGGYFRLNQALASGNSDANGYGTFEYAPPSGFYALCSKNLAEFG